MKISNIYAIICYNLIKGADIIYHFTAFIKEDLKVFYHRCDAEEERLPEKPGDNNGLNIYYKMIYIKKGNYRIVNGLKEFNINDNALLFSKANTPLKMTIISDDQGEMYPFEYFVIQFFPNALDCINSNDDYLRAFHNLPDEARIIRNSPYFDKLFSNIAELVIKQYGRYYIKSILTSVITQICMYYDSLNTNEIVTDSIYVKILRYINNNFINIKNSKNIEDIFFISSTTLNTIVKEFTGFTFWEYIVFLRVEYANRLLKSGQFSVSKCGEMAGFNDYSAFFKAFKKHYNLSPKQAKENNGIKNWPLE